MHTIRSWFRSPAAILLATLSLSVSGCGDAVAPILSPELPPGPQLAIGNDPVSGASIETNLDDYVPGEIVHLVLKGWAPGEDVRLVMTEDPDTHADVDTTITVNGQGEWSGHFYDVQEHDLGVTFTLTGTGQASGRVATVVFTDARSIHQLTITPSSPATGGAASLAVRVLLNSGSGAVVWQGTSWTLKNASNVVVASSGCINSQNHSVSDADTFDGNKHEESFGFTAPATPGAYTLDVSVYSTDACATPTNRSVSFTVVSGNTAPTVKTAAADATGNEGSALTTSGTFEDADGDDLAITKVSGLGTVTDNGDGTWSWSYTPTDNGFGSVTVQADDGEGGTVTDEFDWTAANVAPTVTGVTAPDAVDEGGTITFSATDVTDPSSDDVTAGFEFAYSCDGGTTFGSYTTDASSTCSAPDGPATITVAVKAKDKDGGESSAVTKAVTVNNVAPTVSLSGPTSSNEGETQSYSYSFTDPGADTWTHTTSCGANGTKSDDMFSEAGKSGSFKCTWTDNYVGQVVSAKVADDDTGEDTATRTVNIANVAPTLTSVTGPSGPVPVGTIVNLTLVFTDPAGPIDNPFSVEVNWDGTGYVAAGALSHGGGTVTTTYATPGVNTVCARVTDKDGGVSDPLCYEFIIVYDPSAGFVTGGGWINSPPGAYVDDPSLVGKATFGFVSKYVKGKALPTGNTQFQFKAGDLNFSSTSYEWLVVSGARAQFKGAGTINGSGDYRFMLTVIDGQINGGGGTDKFRIRIWNNAGGGLVYDNQLNAPDSAAPTTEIGGGSIVIHVPK